MRAHLNLILLFCLIGTKTIMAESLNSYELILRPSHNVKTRTFTSIKISHNPTFTAPTGINAQMALKVIRTPQVVLPSLLFSVSQTLSGDPFRTSRAFVMERKTSWVSISLNPPETFVTSILL